MFEVILERVTYHDFAIEDFLELSNLKDKMRPNSILVNLQLVPPLDRKGHASDQTP